MAFTGVPTRLPFRPAAPSPLCRTASTHVLPRRTRVTSQLVGMPEGFGKSIEPDDNEVILAEMRFSDPSKLPMLVQNALPILDESFYTFLEEKINTSADIEERQTLRDLRDAITDIMKQLYDAQMKDASAESTAPEGAPDGPAIDVSAGGADIADATYDELIDKLVAAGTGAELKTAVGASYDRVDMRLLERLSERVALGGSDASALAGVRDTINAVMKERVATATEALKTVLAAGDPVAMRKQIDLLARQGKVDDAFMLLLQANVEQAAKAGAEQAVKVMKMVLEHAMKVKEVGLDPEIKLIRSLIRTEDSETRVKMLMEGLKPRQTVTSIDGNPVTNVKVDGKKFVIALRKLIEEFGNVDEKFVLKLSQIGEESEAVARKLFDMEDKDVRDLQDEAFHKRSVSIWDLERIEVEEELEGRKAPWEGQLGEIPAGFDPEGKMEI